MNEYDWDKKWVTEAIRNAYLIENKETMVNALIHYIDRKDFMGAKCMLKYIKERSIDDYEV